VNITAFAIDKTRVFFSLVLFLILFGITSYQGMPRSEDPGFIIRVALVSTLFPGASPERVEMLVTDKLEKVIQELPELDFVASQSKTGASLIFVNIKEEYTDMRPIWDKLRRKVEKALPDLPDGVVGPTVDDEFGDVYGTQIAITGDGFSYAELKEVADEIRDELLLQTEIAKVEVVGVQEERIFVIFDNAALSDLNMSPLQLQQALQARNIILPGGDLQTEYEKIVFEPTGNFSSVDELRRTLIDLPDSNALVRVDDVLDIERGYVDPPATMARYNGEPALILAISLKEGGNIVALGDGVRNVLQRAESIYPVGIEFDVLLFQPDVVANKINTFAMNLGQAIIIVGLVMLVFLGVRTGLVVTSLIPVAILTSILVMSVLDMDLNQVSLSALIIALGMLVDNAIVMSESIMVRMSNGVPARKAALDSASELRVPLLTSSLTTSAAFLPIYLAQSMTGEYTRPLFEVVTITLLCSWVMALTLIPALCVVFLKVKQRESDTDQFEGRFYKLYRSALIIALQRPWLVLAGVTLVFVAALQLTRVIPTLFFPQNDRATFTVDLEQPVGSPISRTETVVSAVEDYLHEEWKVSDERSAGVVNWATFLGQGAPRYVLPYTPELNSPNYAYLIGNMTSFEYMQGDFFASMRNFVNNNFPDTNVTVRALPLGSPAWPPVAVRVFGRDTDKIFELAERVKKQLKNVPGTLQIADNWGARSKKVIVNVDGRRARLAGVTNQDIAISLQTFLSGLEATRYREGDELIPVVVRSRKEQRAKPERFATINVYSQATGNSVPLSQVATPELAWQPGVVERRNRLRTVTVESLLQPGVTAAQVNAQMKVWLDEESKSWPFGYGWEFGGEAETSGDANSAIGEKVPVAMLIIVLLLIAQFNSLRRPLIIMATIPLALIGVFVGLFVTRSYIGFMTILGIISLSGIVINNAIVLLDRIRIEIDENNLPPEQALVTAAQHRLRPILLTTVTTIGGLLPLWLGGGPMWEPMAVAIIFGLLFATMLTLGVVPVLYSLLFKVPKPMSPG
jgi:multidrug efflux pump